MTSMSDKQVKGLSWAIITTLVSGVAVFANGLVVKGIDPLVHTTVKNSFVGLAILTVLITKRQTKYHVLENQCQRFVSL